jgi:D-aminoacyl-tRNA deacylase
MSNASLSPSRMVAVDSDTFVAAHACVILDGKLPPCHIPQAILAALLAGLVCFVGLKSGDTSEDAKLLAARILAARIFVDGESGSNWKQNVTDIDGDVLCVSNFTLYGRWKKSKPDFSLSMQAEEVRR